MSKIQIISDKNKNSQRIRSSLIKNLDKSKIKKSNVTIVIGGDGFMLQTLKKNRNSKKLFYGVNSGNYGFLMNKFSVKNTINNINKSNMISISPLEMIVKNNKNKIRKNIAINEVSILRQSRQAASISINYGSKKVIKELVSDGVLVKFTKMYLQFLELHHIQVFDSSSYNSNSFLYRNRLNPSYNSKMLYHYLKS